jgi:2-methylcitrate dehydratase PrpD
VRARTSVARQFRLAGSFLRFFLITFASVATSMKHDDQITTRIAHFIAQSQWEDIPASVRHEAKRCLLNFMGAALGGARDEAIERAIAVMSPLAGPRQASVIGRPEGFDMLTAAFVNAASGNVLDFDDTHHPTVIHPTSPIAPPLLALSERQRLAGKLLLHALTLGIEVACRLGNAVTVQHYTRGWHITSTCGVVGAAAACAKILNLDAERTARALGLAANQACGFVESLGSMAKSVSVGNAARNGLFAALLAEQGYTAAPRTLEGPRGFVQVTSDAPDLGALTDRLGEHWEVTRNALKPYPSGVVLHPVIDACLALRAQAGIAARAITRVNVRGNPLLSQRADRPAPRSGREAAVSAQHTVAVCFLFGDAGVRRYTDECVNDPAVQALGAHVSVTDDPNCAVESAQVSVELTDGRTHSAHIAHALGSLSRPMSDLELEAKVRDLAASCIREGTVNAMIDTVWRLDGKDDASELLRLLAASP